MDTKISNLPAVVTPAPTDEFAVNQGGTSKKETRAQLHALESGEHLVLPLEMDAVTPSLAFGDGDTGLFESVDDLLVVAIAGVTQFIWLGNVFRGSTNRAGAVINVGASATVPVLTFESDLDTGLGKATGDQLSMIAGGVEGQRISEAGSAVLHSYQADSGLTAHTGSSQGDGVILSSYNVYSIVANAGDAATLPAVFLADPAMLVHVKNDGANSMDVFPALGDDAGAGTDNAVAILAGDFAVFIATAASATWTKLMGGTA